MPLPLLPIGFQLKADKIMSDLQTALVPIQETYKVQHGGYWQGLQSHAVIPQDGNAAAPNKASHPTDQRETWADVDVPLPASMEIAVAVDVYAGPAGHGYSIRGAVEIAGERWVRIEHVAGPETWRGQDWTKQEAS